MKKILSLITVFVLAFTMLVSCGDEEIGSYIKNYPDVNTKVEELTLNMYIVVGEGTTEVAKKSVQTRLSGHTKTAYSTQLNVHYVDAANYESVVFNAINEGGANMPHIILINSEPMFNALFNAEGGGKLAELTSYFQSKAYGKLNKQIATSLIESSKIDGRLFCVPNNRVVGEYTYLVIDDVAHQAFHYKEEVLKSYKSLADAAELIAEIDATEGYNSSEIVRVVKGPYEARFELSNNAYCNVIEVPTVTKAETFSSAFAVVKNPEVKYQDRAMQIIYAINNDLEFRNILQYGVPNSDYRVVEDADSDLVRIERIKNANGAYEYNMNLMYTGNIFNAYICDQIGWTADAYENGEKQNIDSVAATN
jgi:hypothetical protein